MKKMIRVLITVVLLMGIFQMNAGASNYEKLKIKSIKIDESASSGGSYGDVNNTYDDNTYTAMGINGVTMLTFVIEFEEDIEYIDRFYLNKYFNLFPGIKLYSDSETFLNEPYITSSLNVINRKFGGNKLYLSLDNRDKVRDYLNRPFDGWIKEIEFYGKPKKQSLTLTNVTEVKGEETFSTYININNANNIYAEDIKVKYDQAYMTLENVQIVTSTSSQILSFYHKEIKDGEGRFITVSKGSQSALNTTSSILRLDFKAKNKNGVGKISIVDSKVADGDGKEYSIPEYSINVTIEAQGLGDVNQDGVVSLGDLAIAGRLYGTGQYSWLDYQPDVNNDTRVDDFDLSEIVKTMLKQEKKAS